MHIRVKNGAYAFLGSLATLTSVLVSEMDQEDVPRMTRTFFRLVVPSSIAIGLCWGLSSRGEDDPEETLKQARGATEEDIALLVKAINEKRRMGYSHTKRQETEPTRSYVPTRSTLTETINMIHGRTPKTEEVPYKEGYIRTYKNGKFTGYEKAAPMASEIERDAQKEPVSYSNISWDSGFDPVDETDKMDEEFLRVIELSNLADERMVS